jgi:CRISPR type IV-associated protein Csf3
MHEIITEQLKRYQAPHEFEPLKVIFEMTSPIMLAHPFIHLDGLILHLLYRDLLGDDYYCLPSKNPIDFSEWIKAPIKQTEDIYHASVSFFDTDTKFATTIYKRFCTEYLDLLQTKKRKITRGSGFFRDYMMKMVYIPAKAVFFYVNGNRAEIERLLRHVVSIGKKTAYGFGRVKSLRIEEIDADYSIAKNGIAMRPIPVRMLSDAETTMLLAYKPPYWDKRNVELCAFPQTIIKLK